jgi:hypothetical protein
MVKPNRSEAKLKRPGEPRLTTVLGSTLALAPTASGEHPKVNSVVAGLCRCGFRSLRHWLRAIATLARLNSARRHDSFAWRPMQNLDVTLETWKRSDLASDKHSSGRSEVSAWLRRLLTRACPGSCQVRPAVKISIFASQQFSCALCIAFNMVHYAHPYHAVAI